MSKSLLDGIIGGYAIRTDGTINVEETVKKFQRELTAYAELQQKDMAMLEEHIVGQFKLAPGVAFSREAIIGVALSKVGATPDTWAHLKERANEVLSSDRFYSVRGANGGTYMLSDEDYATFKATGKTPWDRVQDAKNQVKALKKQLKNGSNPS